MAGPACTLLYQGQYFQFSSPDLQWLTKYDINEPLPVFGRPSSYCENLTTPDSKRFFHHNVGAFLEEDKKGLRYEEVPNVIPGISFSTRKGRSYRRTFCPKFPDFPEIFAFAHICFSFRFSRSFRSPIFFSYQIFLNFIFQKM